MPSVVSVPGFIGGSSKSDVMMDSPEELLNMFVEKKEVAENRGYTPKDSPLCRGRTQRHGIPVLYTRWLSRPVYRL